MKRMHPCTIGIVAKADRLDEETADPGPREDRFGDDRAGQHGAELEADECHDRNQAVSEGVPQDRPRTRGASRAGRLHVGSRSSSRSDARVIRARMAASPAPSEIAGEYQVRKRAAARDWQPPQFHGEDDREERTQPEIGIDTPGEGERRRRVIDDGAAPDGCDDAERDRHADGDEHCCSGQLESRRHAVEDGCRDWLVRPQRRAEVASYAHARRNCRTVRGAAGRDRDAAVAP